VGNRLFSFVADCCVGGSSLVVSDGTSAGTYRIQKPLEDVTSARALGSKLFFVETDYGVDPPGQALWVSNGTSAGTHRFAPAPSADQMTILPASGNFLYFTAADSGVGPRLWRTDGTAIGTLALTAAGQLTATPAEAVYMNHAIYFASDGLWRTDGTAAGTLEVSGGSLRDLAKAGGRLFFIRGPQPETADDHLWISNGTKAGTRDLGQFGIDPGGLVGVGGYLCFFAGYTVEKPQLWQSDGTSIGTRLVKSFSFGGSGVPGVAVSGHLYFRANDGTHGNELWKYVP
jgi:ELWxxDGT repeat protein